MQKACKAVPTVSLPHSTTAKISACKAFQMWLQVPHTCLTVVEQGEVPLGRHFSQEASQCPWPLWKVHLQRRPARGQNEAGSTARGKVRHCLRQLVPLRPHFKSHPPDSLTHRQLHGDCLWLPYNPLKSAKVPGRRLHPRVIGAGNVTTCNIRQARRLASLRVDAGFQQNYEDIAMLESYDQDFFSADCMVTFKIGERHLCIGAFDTNRQLMHQRDDADTGKSLDSGHCTLHCI